MSDRNQTDQQAEATRALNPRIAILGAAGIGRVHARIFHAMGADVCAVLGASASSAARSAQVLADRFQIDATPYSDLQALLRESLHGVSICTPAQHHFDQINAVFDAGLPVLCEKPLCWNHEWRGMDYEQRLAKLQSHPARRLFVNTSNATFVKAVADQLPAPDTVEVFRFQFYTQGPNRGRDIAIDLMPHGLSLLLQFFGLRRLSDFDIQVSENRCRCNFFYGGCAVAFDFRQAAEQQKTLAFAFDDQCFQRVQEGCDAGYKVFLETADGGGRLRVEDPFALCIRNFLDYCDFGGADGFDQAAMNLRLMVQCLNQ